MLSLEITSRLKASSGMFCSTNQRAEKMAVYVSKTHLGETLHSIAPFGGTDFSRAFLQNDFWVGSADGSEHFSDERMRGGSFKDVVNCLLLSRSQDKPTVVLECLEKELTYLHQRISTNAVPASIKDRSNHFSKSCKHLWYRTINTIMSPYTWVTETRVIILNATTTAPTSTAAICSALR